MEGEQRRGVESVSSIIHTCMHACTCTQTHVYIHAYTYTRHPPHSVDHVLVHMLNRVSRHGYVFGAGLPVVSWHS